MGALNNIIIFSLWWLSLIIISEKDVKSIEVGNLKITLKKNYSENNTVMISN